MNAPDGQANVAFNATGRLRGLPLAAHGSGGSVLALRDDSTPYPIRFQATLGHTVADVDGTVTGLVALTAADVQLALKGNNLEQLYPLFRVALPATPPYRVAGHLRHRGNRTDYEKFTGRMGGSDLSGGLSVLAGNPPSVQADVVSNTLDLADLGPLIGTPAKGQAETTARTDRLLPDEPFHVDRWKSVNMDIRFRGTHLLHAAQMPLDNLSAHAVLKDGVLRVDPLRFGAVGGEFNSTVVFDGNSDPLQARVDAHVRKLQLARVAPSMKIPNATVGDISGDIHLRGRGNSVARMLSSADGRLGFAVTDGEVSKLLLKLVGLDLGGYIATRVRGDREIPIRCAVASFDAHHGVLDTNVLVLDTPDTNVLGAGDISLASETLNLTLRPQPKKHSLLSLRTPLYVKGSFSHPSVGVNKGQLAARGAAALGLAALNPAAGLVPLIETGPGRDSNCGELVAQVQEQSGRGAPAQRKPG
jgi:AsmA protein